MDRKIKEMYSPFRPRPRKSARLVLVWMALLVLVLWATYYLRYVKGDPEVRRETMAKLHEHRKGGKWQD